MIGNYLSIILATSAKSEMLAQRDPHGFIMTLTAVAVVFGALLLLYIVFGILGKFNSGKLNPKKMMAKATPKSGQKMNEETAAAIAMALKDELSGEVYAAIGMALTEYVESTVHDQESYIITIKRK